jgi:hypothetical protein
MSAASQKISLVSTIALVVESLDNTDVSTPTISRLVGGSNYSKPSPEIKNASAVIGSGRLGCSMVVVRGRVEPPTFRFSGVAIVHLALADLGLTSARRFLTYGVGGRRCRQGCRRGRVLRAAQAGA